MEITDATASQMVQSAFEARNVKNSVDIQLSMLKKSLDQEQVAAAKLLEMMGVGQNLNVVG